MSRYINYDAIDYRNDKMHGKSSDFIDGVIYMAQRIEEAPSIDIVRCKECKRTKDYFKQHTDRLVWCEKWKWAMNTNGYCSYGERKDHERLDRER